MGVFGELGLLLYFLLDVLDGGHPPRGLAEQHFIQDYAQRPYVGFLCVNVLVEDLGGHVEWAANDGR